MVVFAIVATLLTMAGLASIAAGLAQRMFGLQLRLVPVTGPKSVSDQAERWLRSQV